VTKTPFGSNLLSRNDQATYLAAARAIYHIGRERVAELLALEMPSRLLAHLIVELPDRGFRCLLDKDIGALLNSQDGMLRKVMALRCVQSLPKFRLKRLQNTYLNGDTYYYNVVHWLDLEICAPKEIALKAARKALASEAR
jgi:hypothetical protein